MIYFLTVNYYSTELIKSLITSIQTGITSPYEILIVNNSPEDVAVHQLSGEQIRIIEAGDNLGFGRGCNLGINDVWKRDSQGLIWLINPDATLDSGADIHIRKCLSGNPNIAILGTQIRTDNGELWFTEGIFNPWTGLLKHDNRLVHTNNEQLTRSVQWVTGCSLIINLDRFQKLPEFDKNYFLYAEDADFCLRYTKQGYQVAVTNKPLASHRVSSIIGRNTAFMYENYTFGRLFFLKQHAIFFGLSLYIVHCIITLILRYPNHKEESLGRWRGVLKFLSYKAQS